MPVIAIGIPTVVDAISLSSELSGISPEKLDKSKLLNGERMIVAPKDIDLLVKNASYLLALSINCALQPTLTPKELYSLM